MSLNETKFGRIVTELNNFTNLINPEAISQFDNMSTEQLEALSQSGSFTGDVAKWYLDLLDKMRDILDK